MALRPDQRPAGARQTGGPDPGGCRGGRELLGRGPWGHFQVVVRDAGGPVVIRNAPLLDDGTPMPTRYWLCDRDLNRRIGRLEAGGGVRAAEAAVDPDDLAAAHERYRVEREASLPADWTGPRPFGGVAAHAVASSACTPTTPGTSPAATIRSAPGSTSSYQTGPPPRLEPPRERSPVRRRRLRHELDPSADLRRPHPDRAAHAGHPPRCRSGPDGPARPRGDRAHPVGDA